MRLALAVLFVLSCTAPVAHAQRRVTTPLPIDAQLIRGSGAYEYRLSVVARTDVELTGDVRLLRLEVRSAGSRRALSCGSASAPRRIEPSTVRPLRAGAAWTDTFDVRSLCWGRALTALDAGGELGGTFGSSRGARGVVVARAGTTDVRSAPIAPITVAPIAPPAPPTGDVRVTLARSDAASGAHIALRVTVRATRAIRAWVRPDRFRFRVVSPDGSTHMCSMAHGGGAAIPDLFARVSTRSGPMMSLDAAAYCERSVFRAAGIYEVTPILDLDVDGSRWRLDTPLGSFEGAPAAVRVRAGDRS